MKRRSRMLTTDLKASAPLGSAAKGWGAAGAVAAQPIRLAASRKSGKRSMKPPGGGSGEPPAMTVVGSGQLAGRATRRDRQGIVLLVTAARGDIDADIPGKPVERALGGGAVDHRRYHGLDAAGGSRQGKAVGFEQFQGGGVEGFVVVRVLLHGYRGYSGQGGGGGGYSEVGFLL